MSNKLKNAFMLLMESLSFLKMENKGEAELVVDQRPVFTLWKSVGVCENKLSRVVWVFQAEGGALDEESVNAFFDCLEFTVGETNLPFVTFYDFTVGLKNFAPHITDVVQTAGHLREKIKPVRTIIYCNDNTARKIVRLVIKLIGGRRPWAIVDSVESAWEMAYKGESSGSTDVDFFAGEDEDMDMDNLLALSA